MVGECEEAFLFGLFGTKAGLDEINENAVGAGLPLFGEMADASGEARR